MKTQNYKNTEPSAADFSKVDSLIEIADESKQNKPVGLERHKVRGFALL